MLRCKAARYRAAALVSVLLLIALVPRVVGSTAASAASNDIATGSIGPENVDITVYAYDASGTGPGADLGSNAVASADVPPDGSSVFSFSLPDGSYVFEASSSSLGTMWFDGAGDVATSFAGAVAQKPAVLANGATVGIPGLLDLGGDVSWLMYDIYSGQPFFGAKETVYLPDCQTVVATVGYDQEATLPAGEYVVEVTAPGYDTEWFGDYTYSTVGSSGASGSTCNSVASDPLVVANNTYTQHNYSIYNPSEAVWVSGQVTTTSGQPIPFVSVTDTADTSSSTCCQATTDANGNWSMLVPRDQAATILANGGGPAAAGGWLPVNPSYSAEYYGNVYDPADATPVEDTNTADEYINGVNVQLTNTALVTGHVYGLASGESVKVVAYDEFGQTVGIPGEQPDPTGPFVVEALHPGIYHLHFALYDGAAVVASWWYGDQSTEAGSIPVVVTAGEGVTELNEAAPPETELVGATSGLPQGSVILVYSTANASTPVAAATVTEANTYEIPDIAPGNYKIEMVPWQWYGGSGFKGAQTITVTRDANRTDLSGAPTGNVTAVIRGVDGSGPPNDLSATVYDAAGDIVNQEQTGLVFITGYYNVSRVPVGNYQIVFTDPSGQYLPYTGKIVVTAGATANFGPVQLLDRVRNTIAPATSGTPLVGYILQSTPGSWLANEVGGPYPLSGLHLSYQWLRNGKPIPGATTSSHKLTAADAGTSVRVQVTATKATYETSTALSRPTASIKARSITSFVAKALGRGEIRITVLVTAHGIPARGSVVVRVGGRNVRARLTGSRATIIAARLKHGTRQAISVTFAGAGSVLGSKSDTRTITVR